MNEQKTVTLKEARFAIGCGEKFLRAEIKRGAIAVRRVNARVILVYLNSLNGYIESRRTTSDEKIKARRCEMSHGGRSQTEESGNKSHELRK